MSNKALLPLLFAIFIQLSCGDNLETQINKPLMVVEGWIENGEFPVVMLSQTVTVGGGLQSMDSLDNYIVKWGVVRISDGEREVVLTGKYDESYNPPYIYTTNDMRGEAGKTYTVQADYKDFHASASTTIPMSPKKMDVSWSLLPKDTSRYQLFVNFECNGEDEEFYKIFIRSDMKSKQYLSAYLGLLDCSNAATRCVKMPVYRGRSMQEEKYTPYFYGGEAVCVKLVRIDKESFSFWNEYEQLLALSGNIFFPMTSNFHSNIRGGIGYWSGYGKQEVLLTLPGFSFPTSLH